MIIYKNNDTNQSKGVMRQQQRLTTTFDDRLSRRRTYRHLPLRSYFSLQGIADGRMNRMGFTDKAPACPNG